ncbi:MAG: VCBS repeat-containing protein [Puniceicoccaceae bacterium]
MTPTRRHVAAFSVLILILAIPVLYLFFILLRLKQSPTEVEPASVPSPRSTLSLDIAYHGEPVGFPVTGRPWIPDLQIHDLDQDGLLDILVCDGVTDTVSWIRQFPRNQFTEYILAKDIKGPAHIEACDIDLDGDDDLLVASMGMIRPNNDKIGTVVVLENLGDQTFRRHDLITNVARVTDIRGGDFDGDGDIDLVVGQFGYSQGEIRWMENLGNWEFKSHGLLALSGTVHTPVADIDQDGDLDIIALVSQEWEEIHLFENDGTGNFNNRIIWASTNEDYGSSGLQLVDLDRDGDLDIIYTNGDGFDYAKPGPRPWHGIQWLENRGQGFFKFHRVSDYPGAYSPVAVDLNGDSFLDLIAVASVNNWHDPKTVSMMAWINDGNQHFTAVPLATTPTHLIVAKAADLDQDGIPEIVTGGLHAYPPYGNLSRVMIWRQKGLQGLPDSRVQRRLPAAGS